MRPSPLALLALLACGCAGGGANLSPGAPCASEGVGRCDGEAPRLLQCVGGAYVVYADCKGPRGCTASGSTADCDTSGNGLGDRCAPPSEGKVRCDPDGGVNILRCVDGGLSLEFACPPGRTCGLGDAGLTCL